MLVSQICFFVVVSLFHTSAFRIEKKCLTKEKKSVITDFFLLQHLNVKYL